MKNKISQLDTIECPRSLECTVRLQLNRTNQNKILLQSIPEKDSSDKSSSDEPKSRDPKSEEEVEEISDDDD